jgi:hypothetical protein
MPTKFTAATREQLLGLLQAGHSRQAASQAVGIDRLTFRRWMKRGEKVPDGKYGEFRQAVLAAEKAAPRLVVLPAKRGRTDSEADRLFKWLVRQGEFDEEHWR